MQTRIRSLVSRILRGRVEGREIQTLNADADPQSPKAC